MLPSALKRLAFKIWPNAHAAFCRTSESESCKGTKRASAACSADSPMSPSASAARLRTVALLSASRPDTFTAIALSSTGSSAVPPILPNARTAPPRTSTRGSASKASRSLVNAAAASRALPSSFAAWRLAGVSASTSASVTCGGSTHPSFSLQCRSWRIKPSMSGSSATSQLPKCLPMSPWKNAPCPTATTRRSGWALSQARNAGTRRLRQSTSEAFVCVQSSGSSPKPSQDVTNGNDAANSDFGLPSSHFPDQRSEHKDVSTTRHAGRSSNAMDAVCTARLKGETTRSSQSASSSWPRSCAACSRPRSVNKGSQLL
mmetsp:Transcript_78858/g.219258  ORF Transcript_78858/g.219258 Transcript_78858/m.219258 type:complete len:317 (+) Transcript_78858:819-1769(+)